GERHMERIVFALVVAAPGGEIDAAATQKVERRPLLGDADRVMQRQHGDRGREPDALGLRRHYGEHEIGAGEPPDPVEVVLPDPGRMHAERVGMERFRRDAGDELVGAARIVVVVVVAQCEVAELHGDLLHAVPLGLPLHAAAGIIDAQAIIAIAIIVMSSVYLYLGWDEGRPGSAGTATGNVRLAQIRLGSQSLVQSSPMPDRLDLANYLPYLVNRLGSALVASFTATALTQHDLNIDAWRVMAVPPNRGAQRQIDLAALTSVEVSTLSRLPTRLVRQALGSPPPA